MSTSESKLPTIITTLNGEKSYVGAQDLDRLFEETKGDIELSKEDMFELEEMISFEATPRKNMILMPGAMERNIISPLSNTTHSAIDNSNDNRSGTIRNESSRLSELAKQLRALQAKNKYQASETERLERQLKIVSDLKGVSVIDMRKTLKLVCKEQASQELKNQILSLQAQLEQYRMKKTSPRSISQESASREMANLQLRAGELEEIEETLRKEIRTLYQRLRDQIAKATTCEASKNKLMEKVQRHEEEIQQKVNDSIESEKERKGLSLMKQKLISYLRKLHVDLKLEKDKNESLNNQMKLQMKISKDSRGLTEDSINILLLEKHDNLHRDVQLDSNEKSTNIMAINQTNFLEEEHSKNTKSEINEAASASESPNGTTSTIFQSKSAIAENNLIKRSKVNEKPYSTRKLQDCGDVSGELGKHLESRRTVINNETQRNLDANGLEQKYYNQSESRSQMPIKKSQNNRLSGELNEILQRRSNKCLEYCGNSEEKSMNEILNEKQKPIGKLDKHTGIAKEISNILQGKSSQEELKLGSDMLEKSFQHKPNKMKQNGVLAESLSKMLQRRIPPRGAKITQPENKNISKDEQQESYLSKPNKLGQNKALAENLTILLQKRNPQAKKSTTDAENADVNASDNKQPHIRKLKKESNVSNVLDGFLQDKIKKCPKLSTRKGDYNQSDFDKEKGFCGKPEESQTSGINNEATKDEAKSMQQNMPKITSNQKSLMIARDQNLDEIHPESVSKNKLENENSTFSTGRDISTIPGCIFTTKENMVAAGRSTVLKDPIETIDDIEAKIDAELEKIIKEAQHMAGVQYCKQEKNGGERTLAALSKLEKPVFRPTIYEDEISSFPHEEYNSYALVGTSKPKNVIDSVASPSTLKDMEYYVNESNNTSENTNNLRVKTGYINEEVGFLYEKLREQTCKAVTLEATCEELQADIERQKKNVLENENNQHTLKYDYDQALEEHNRLYQKVCDYELQLTVQKENAENLEQQIAAREKESSLHKDQFNSRFELQQERIIDMKQQLSSLYTAFGILDEECTEQKEEYSELKSVLGEADSRIARQLQTELENSVKTTTATSIATGPTTPNNKNESFDDTNRSMHLGKIVPTPPSRRTNLEVSTPLSFSSLRSPTPGSSRTSMTSTLEPSLQSRHMEGYLYKFDKNILKGWKKRYFVLKGSNEDYQLTYSTGPLEKIKGIIPLITGISIVMETREFLTQEPSKFVLALNLDPQNEREAMIYLATNSRQTMEQWKAAFEIVTENKLVQGNQEVDDLQLAMQIQMQMHMQIER